METNTGNRWLVKIDLADVFHDEARTFFERRDEIVRRLRASGWVGDDASDLWYAVDELADAEDENGFDVVWDVIYDHADADRVWIGTF